MQWDIFETLFGMKINIMMQRLLYCATKDFGEDSYILQKPLILTLATDKLVVRNTVPEIIDSGPMCITDLF